MRLRVPFAGLAAVLAMLGGGAGETRRTPVLVELFTSEGCSSCPPADVLLQQLEHSQPVANAEIIVLSEHVDYWNRIGWTDPYSSPLFSARQQVYAQRFRLDGVYTPQMIVDGAAEFVGSDGRTAFSAITASVKREKVPVRLSRTDSGVRVEVDPLPPAAGRGEAGVYLAIAENQGTSDVLRGENKGRKLHHIAIARRIQQVGSVNNRVVFLENIALPAMDAGKRVIAFVQEHGTGRVWGAAMLTAAEPSVDNRQVRP